MLRAWKGKAQLTNAAAAAGAAGSTAGPERRGRRGNRALVIGLSAVAVSLALAAFGIARAVEPVSPSGAAPQPSSSAGPNGAASTAAPSPSPTPIEACEQIGQFQRQVEQALAQMGGYGPVTVDGVQTESDCETIKVFQTRFGLRPVDGIAGPGTHGVAQRLLASNIDQCDAGDHGVTACVDLTNQTTWLVRDGEIVHGPTVMRSGMKKFATPTGHYEVEWKAIKDWSEPYKVWLPYWQGFNDGIGFHETTSYLHNAAAGSHGCINLLHQDAKTYWNELEEGSSVVVFGHRSGT